MSIMRMNNFGAWTATLSIFALTAVGPASAATVSWTGTFTTATGSLSGLLGETFLFEFEVDNAATGVLVQSDPFATVMIYSGAITSEKLELGGNSLTWNSQQLTETSIIDSNVPRGQDSIESRSCSNLLGFCFNFFLGGTPDVIDNALLPTQWDPSLYRRDISYFLLYGNGGVAESRQFASTASSVPPSPVPIPAALPLMLSALGVFGFMGWRRRKAVAA